MRTLVSVAVLCLAVSTVHAVSLNIVEVSAPAINCVFDADCTIEVTDFADHFVLPGTVGKAFLQSRRFPPGEPTTVAEGLYAYVYRIDLRDLTGQTALPCLHTFQIDFGPIVRLDYDGNGAPDDIFVITTGGLGTMAPLFADQVGDTVTFGFNPPVCVGSSPGSGQSTFFFGLTAAKPSMPVGARVRDTFSNEITLEVQAPLKVVNVDCRQDQSLRAALEQAKPGATLRITGTCKEPITILQDGIILDGGGQTTIVGNGATAVITIDGRQDVVIKNLTLSGGLDGILVQGGASVILESVQAVQNVGDGFQVDGGARVHCVDCLASHNGANGFFVLRRSHTTFHGSIASLDNRGHGIEVSEHATAVFGETQCQTPSQTILSQPPGEGTSSRRAQPALETAVPATAAFSCKRCSGTPVVPDPTNSCPAKHDEGDGIVIGNGSHCCIRRDISVYNNGGDGIRFISNSSGDIFEATVKMLCNGGAGLSLQGGASVRLDGSWLRTLRNEGNGVLVSDSTISFDFPWPWMNSRTHSRVCSQSNEIGLVLDTHGRVLCNGNGTIILTLFPSDSGTDTVNPGSTLSQQCQVLRNVSTCSPPSR